MATRDDVARLAGVSSSTVSYVISGKRKISAETTRRVESAMRELNYTPNAFARGLAGARGGILALHYPTSAHGLTSTEFEYVSAATERARERGFHLVLWTTGIDDLDALQGLVRQGLVDGVILMELVPMDPRVSILRESQVPFVTIGRPIDEAGIAYADNDYESLARQAIDHVADLGHTNVLFLGQNTRPFERGFGPLLRTVDALKLPARRRGVRLSTVNAEYSVKGGRDAFERLLGLDPRPTAVITFNEMATPGLVNAAALAGVAIPEDLAVVALSVGPMAAEMLSPPLTTVSPPSTVIARTASGWTKVACVPALWTSKRSPARCLSSPSAIWERAELWVHKNSTRSRSPRLPGSVKGHPP